MTWWAARDPAMGQEREERTRAAYVHFLACALWAAMCTVDASCCPMGDALFQHAAQTIRQVVGLPPGREP
jgi:hypothetical protein